MITGPSITTTSDEGVFKIWDRVVELETGAVFMCRGERSGIVKDEKGETVDGELAAIMLCAKAMKLHRTEARGRA